MFNIPTGSIGSIPRLERFEATESPVIRACCEGTALPSARLKVE
jgi:hypothetical protein